MTGTNPGSKPTLSKRNKLLKWFLLYPLVVTAGFIVIALIVEVFTADERKAEEARVARSQDSIEQLEQARIAVHDSLMTHDERYADSVRRYEKQQADSIAAVRRQDSLDAHERDRAENPKRHVTLDMDWRTGGFGSVALANVKIHNQSLKTCVNPKVLVRFYSENGTELSSRRESIYITIPPGKRRTSQELNLGFINRQASRAGVELIDATWE